MDSHTLHFSNGRFVNDGKPKVSVAVMTYNQSDYISEALESVLSQNTDFAIEILIHDDASTDGTQQIIDTYRSKYPDIIRTIKQKENQHSQGRRIIEILWPELQGDYIALLDGDDCWTLKDKLARQVKFLDENPDCALCQGRTRYVQGSNRRSIRSFPPRRHRQKRRELEHMAPGNFVQTSNVMIRKSMLPAIPEGFECLPFGDYALFALAAQSGWIGYINEEMAFYRIHSNNMWAQTPLEDRLAKTETVRAFIATRLPPEQRDPWLIPLKKSGFLRKMLRTAIKKLFDRQ
nr:glycosyltransferase [Halovulum dunhuangense]